MVMPVWFLFRICLRWRPTLTHPDSGSLLTTPSHVPMYLPPSRSRHFGAGNWKRSTLSPVRIFFFTGPLLTTTGLIGFSNLFMYVFIISLGGVSFGSPIIIAILG